MTGRKKGVILFVRRQQQEVHMSGCCIHLVHIAAKTGASCLLPFDNILVDIFHFFKKTVNRQTDFKESVYVRPGSAKNAQTCLHPLAEHWKVLRQAVDKLDLTSSLLS